MSQSQPIQKQNNSIPSNQAQSQIQNMRVSAPVTQNNSKNIQQSGLIPKSDIEHEEVKEADPTPKQDIQLKLNANEAIDLKTLNLGRCFVDMKKWNALLSQLSSAEIPLGMTLDFILMPVDPEHMSYSFLKKFTEDLEKVKGVLLAECRLEDSKAANQMWGKTLREFTVSIAIIISDLNDF